ncbi:hypothetical protein B0H11DRAFT_1812212 [Mycena galericulata]|nr:hypothetical protein B0H11DRAFT_1812212 [Mycena galericulata]
MSCPSHCSVRGYAAEEPDASLLLNCPYPDLLSSNTVPSDSQLPVIHDALQRAEEGIVARTHMILQLQDQLAELENQRSELDIFVKRHRAAVSTLRRLPSEILLEIFAHCRDDNLTNNAPWGIVRVCSRWRAVALASPRLWSYFSVQLRDFEVYSGREDTSLQLERSGHAPLSIKVRGVVPDVLGVLLSASTRWHDLELHLPVPLLRDILQFQLRDFEVYSGREDTSLQLERSGHAPLSIKVRGVVPDVLGVLLSASTRWHDLELHLPVPLLRDILQFQHSFPILEKLEIDTWSQMLSDPIPSFIASLPALKELTLAPARGLLPAYFTHIQWSRLRSCTLKKCPLRETLRAMSLLSPGTRLVIDSPSNRIDALTGHTSSSILSLTFTNCHLGYIRQMFGALTTPSLEELDLADDIHASQHGNCGPHEIISFLARSACPLTRLRIGYPRLSEDDLFGILKSPPLNGLTTLEVAKDTRLSSSRGIRLLTSPTLAAHLRSLTLRCTLHFTEAELLRMVASRRPVLQSLRLETFVLRGDWTLSQNSLRKLSQEGLQVTLLSYGPTLPMK